MMFENEIIELNDELNRAQQMEYYKYHSFLNGMEKIFKNYEKIDNEEVQLAILSFAGETIKRFIDIYGSKKLPKEVRKAAQNMIIKRKWNFN